MSYTFICTKDNAWYLKIVSVEQLLDYWDDVFNPEMKHALDTILDTKEFGTGYNHCTEIQAMIGFMARGNNMTYKEAHDKIVYDTRIMQYQAIYDGHDVYINKKMGWNSEPKEADQFVHKSNFEFPVMKSERLDIKQFPLGKHYYVFIDGVQLRHNGKVKFDTYEDAFFFASKYLK